MIFKKEKLTFKIYVEIAPILVEIAYQNYKALIEYLNFAEQQYFTGDERIKMIQKNRSYLKSLDNIKKELASRGMFIRHETLVDFISMQVANQKIKDLNAKWKWDNANLSPLDNFVEFERIEEFLEDHMVTASQFNEAIFHAFFRVILKYIPRERRAILMKKMESYAPLLRYNLSTSCEEISKNPINIGSVVIDIPPLTKKMKEITGKNIYRQIALADAIFKCMLPIDGEETINAQQYTKYFINMTKKSITEKAVKVPFVKIKRLKDLGLKP